MTKLDIHKTKAEINRLQKVAAKITGTMKDALLQRADFLQSELDKQGEPVTP